MAEKKILVVDDTPTVLCMVSENLKSNGYYVETANGCEDALEKVEKTSFNLVILDYMMPGKDGMDTLTEMSHKGHRMPVIFYTSYIPEQMKAAATMFYNVRAFINKNSPISELLEAVRKTLE